MKKENALVEEGEVLQYFKEVDRSLSDIHAKNGRIPSFSIDPHILKKMVDFMLRVIYGTEMPFVVSIDQKSGKQIVKVQKLGMDFPILPSFVNLYASDLHYSPLLRLFWKAYRLHSGIQESILCWSNRTLLCSAERMVVFNEFVLFMRQLAKEHKTKTEIANWQRNIKTNCTRLDKYMEALFLTYGRLDFIRVDFHFHACVLTEAEVDAALDRNQANHQTFWDSDMSSDKEGPIIPEGRVSLEEVMKARDRFLGNARRKTSLFKDMVGHVTRIEFSRSAQYHMHVTLIFAHSEIKNHAWLAEQISEYWVKITDGHGYAYNCNRKQYKYPALGTINYYETEKRETLMKALRYLAKLDQFVHAKAAKRGKLFTTGHFPKVKETRRGRPRKKGGSGKECMSEIAMSQLRGGFLANALKKNTEEA